jgi:hypothetical protein
MINITCFTDYLLYSIIIEDVALRIQGQIIPGMLTI